MIKKKEILLFLIVLILAALVYCLIAINQLNLITGILFLAAVSVSVFLVAEIAMKILKRSANTRNNIRLLVITVGILLIGLELFLRFGLNKYSNYMERNGSINYYSIYQNRNPSWFHVHGKNQDEEYSKKEFTHIRKVNSLGLAEQEIDVEKAHDEYRIIALGDSFTEGLGTSYDSTWVKVVEKNLTEHMPHKKVTTMNAGIAGSDPYFEYILLREKLLPFKPDLVIVATNHSDIQDVIIRGGMERFQADGSMRFGRKAPNWEWAYGISYIFRHIIHDIFHYNWLFIQEDNMESEARKAVEKIKAILDEFDRLSQEHGFDLLVAIHPHEWEIQMGTYGSGFYELISALEHDQGIDFIDLLEYYKVNQIMTNENASEFFWSIDLHHNTQGYAAMGKAIAAKILASKLLPDLDVHDTPPSVMKTSLPDTPPESFKQEDNRERKWWLRVDGGSVANLVFPPENPEMVRIAIEKFETKNPWDIQLNQPYLAVRANHRYVVIFRVRADSPRTINVGFAKAHDPWDSLGLYQKLDLTTEWQSFELKFTATADDDNARILFDLGKSEISVELSDVILRSLADGQAINPNL